MNKRGFKESTGDEGKTIVNEGEHSETEEDWESEKEGGGGKDTGAKNQRDLPSTSSAQKRYFTILSIPMSLL